MTAAFNADRTNAKEAVVAAVSALSAAMNSDHGAIPLSDDKRLWVAFGTPEAICGLMSTQWGGSSVTRAEHKAEEAAKNAKARGLLDAVALLPQVDGKPGQLRQSNGVTAEWVSPPAEALAGDAQPVGNTRAAFESTMIAHGHPENMFDLYMTPTPHYYDPMAQKMYDAWNAAISFASAPPLPVAQDAADLPKRWEDRQPESMRQLGTALSQIDYMAAELAEWRARAAVPVVAQDARAEVDTTPAEYNTGDKDLDALLELTDDMARLGGNHDTGELWMVSCDKVLAKLGFAAPSVAVAQGAQGDDHAAFEVAYIAKMQAQRPHKTLDKYEVESFLKRDANGHYITAHAEWAGWVMARSLSAPSLPAVAPQEQSDQTGDDIAAADRLAENYQDDDRQDIKSDVINAFYAGLRHARKAAPQQPEAEPTGAGPLPIVLELPDGDDRTASVVYSVIRDGKQHICITVSDRAQLVASELSDEQIVRACDEIYLGNYPKMCDYDIAIARAILAAAKGASNAG